MTKRHIKDLQYFKDRALKREIPIASRDTLDTLSELLAAQKPTHCVEFGTAIGRGSLHIARQLSKRGGRLTSFEISYPSYHKARKFLQSQEIYNCKLYHLDITACKLSILLHRPIDFAFIDARKASYIDYYKQLRPLLSDKATLVFDDVYRFSKKIGGLRTILEKDGRDCEKASTDNSNDQLLIASRK